MMTSTPTLHTKLPKVGTTIFTVMSKLPSRDGADVGEYARAFRYFV